MAFCIERCCNPAAKAKYEAEQAALKAQHQAEFERLYPDPRTAKATPEATTAQLTEDELNRLESWFLRHPAAVG